MWMLMHCKVWRRVRSKVSLSMFRWEQLFPLSTRHWNKTSKFPIYLTRRELASLLFTIFFPPAAHINVYKYGGNNIIDTCMKCENTHSHVLKAKNRKVTFIGLSLSSNDTVVLSSSHMTVLLLMIVSSTRTWYCLSPSHMRTCLWLQGRYFTPSPDIPSYFTFPCLSCV